MWLALRHAWFNLWDKHMSTGRINQGTVTALRVPPRGRRGTSSYLLLLLLAAHSRTCRPAHTRPAPQVLGDHGTRLQSEIVRVAASHPGSWRADCMRQVRRADCRIGPRPQADRRDVAMRVNQFTGRRTARSSPPSHTLRPPEVSNEPSWTEVGAGSVQRPIWQQMKERWAEASLRIHPAPGNGDLFLFQGRPKSSWLEQQRIYPGSRALTAGMSSYHKPATLWKYSKAALGWSH